MLTEEVCILFFFFWTKTNRNLIFKWTKFLSRNYFAEFSATAHRPNGINVGIQMLFKCLQSTSIAECNANVVCLSSAGQVRWMYSSQRFKFFIHHVTNRPDSLRRTVKKGPPVNVTKRKIEYIIAQRRLSMILLIFGHSKWLRIFTWSFWKWIHCVTSNYNWNVWAFSPSFGAFVSPTGCTYTCVCLKLIYKNKSWNQIVSMGRQFIEK